MEVDKEYATALFSLAKETGQEKEIYEGLAAVTEVFRKNPDYMSLLGSQSIPKEERAQVLDVAFGGRIPEDLLSFVSLLSDRNRIFSYYQCADEYNEMYLASLNRVIAKVTSAVALTGEKRSRILLAIAKKTVKEVVLESIIDPSIIGSIIVEYDGKILDGSVRRRIDTMKEVISNEP